MSLGYSWLGQDLALDLANTVIVVRPGETLDGLADEADLARWIELERDRLGALLTAAAEGVDLPAHDAATVNRMSAAAPWFVQLHPRAGAVVESRARNRVDGVLGAIAASAVELLGGPDRRVVRVCAAPRCGLYFLAGRKRQWCSASCGNRARVARHYARNVTAG
jgi:predicted RNA-binding Zn ribbon-like protein